MSDNQLRFDEPIARATDPTTSHQAAASVTNQTTIRDRVLYELRHDPLTFDQLLARFAATDIRHSPSGVRTRTRELVDAGLVESHPTRRGTTPAGRACALWQLTIEGRHHIYQKGWTR